MSENDKILMFICLLLIGYYKIVESKYINLKPIKINGLYRLETSNYYSIYLSKLKLEIYENDNDKDSNNKNGKEMILCDVLPIIIQDETGKDLVNKHINNAENKVSSLLGISGSPVVSRDRGIYDNLPYSWKSKDSKKQLYQSMLRISNEKANLPYKTFLEEFNKAIQCKLVGLFIDNQDEYSTNSVSLGGSLLITRDSNNESMKEILSSKPPSSLVENINSFTSCYVDCFLDEVICLSIELDIPIYVPEYLFESLSVDASLTENNSNFVIEGPINIKNIDEIRPSKTNDNPAPKAWDILDPTLFFKLSTADKRAILRSSNVKKLPHPRDGKEAVDDLLLDIMDDAVRGEIFRIIAKNPSHKGNTSNDGEMNSRQDVLQSLSEAIENNDINKAMKLKEKFTEMTSIRADPTQAVGSYDKYLDQDDWYMQQRKRAMQSKKKS